jgi:pyruvate, water dikinase
MINKMINIKEFCKKILISGLRPGPENNKTDPATREFKTKYWNFKNLLALNQKILENMSAMEQAHAGSRVYGFGFLRKSTAELSVCLFRVITLLDRIAPGKYRTLLQKFEVIHTRLNLICADDEHCRTESCEWICRDIRELNCGDTDMAGAKSANLGEIRDMPGITIPDGFIFSARASKLFMEKNRLLPHLEQIIQCIDFDDLTMVNEADRRLRGLIENSVVPDEILNDIDQSYKNLRKTHGPDVRFAVRSSATGEDSLRTSFAGQYRTILEVAGEDLSTAYKKVLASKYSARAMLYRHNKGLCDNHVHMCVAILVMQDAVSSGVIYTRNPENNAREIIISALRGLPKALVDGLAEPDLFVYSRDQGKLIHREIHEQRTMLSRSPEKGMETVILDPGSGRQPAVHEELADKLFRIALDLENHFQQPQDIEWCVDSADRIVILQARPLQTHKTTPDETKTEDSCTAFREKIASRRILPVLKGGITVCRGVASGRVHMVTNAAEAENFPDGAIMVAREALPRWSTLVGKASGLITNHGAAAGHLATVAREFNVPALFNTKSATTDLAGLTHITLDAGAGEIYPEIIPCDISSDHKTNIMSGTPVHMVMEKTLSLVRPLNLTDPEKNSFSPEHCRTYHDILRFCHEKAVDEMFSLGGQYEGADTAGKRLVAGAPTQWWLIDLGGGFNKQITGNKVRLNEVVSRPFLGVWEGMTSHVWQGPPGADARGLFSIMMESTMNRDLDLSGPSAYTQKNYGLISGSFCSLSCRFGYHYSVLQSLCKDLDRENYIRFGFKGGAANMDRKHLRLKLMSEIMEESDFQVKIKEDVLNGSFEGGSKEKTMNRLKILGYLIVHTRQVDMVMSDTNQFAFYLDKMKKDIKNIV